MTKLNLTYTKEQKNEIILKYYGYDKRYKNILKSRKKWFDAIFYVHETYKLKDLKVIHLVVDLYFSPNYNYSYDEIIDILKKG